MSVRRRHHPFRGGAVVAEGQGRFQDGRYGSINFRSADRRTKAKRLFLPPSIRECLDGGPSFSSCVRRKQVSVRMKSL